MLHPRVCGTVLRGVFEFDRNARGELFDEALFQAFASFTSLSPVDASSETAGAWHEQRSDRCCRPKQDNGECCGVKAVGKREECAEAERCEQPVERVLMSDELFEV